MSNFFTLEDHQTGYNSETYMNIYSNNFAQLIQLFFHAFQHGKNDFFANAASLFLEDADTVQRINFFIEMHEKNQNYRHYLIREYCDLFFKIDEFKERTILHNKELVEKYLEFCKTSNIDNNIEIDIKDKLKFREIEKTFPSFIDFSFFENVLIESLQEDVFYISKQMGCRSVYDLINYFSVTVLSRMPDEKLAKILKNKFSMLHNFHFRIVFNCFVATYRENKKITDDLQSMITEMEESKHKIHEYLRRAYEETKKYQKMIFNLAGKNPICSQKIQLPKFLMIGARA